MNKTVYFNGVILTMRDKKDFAEAVYTVGDRIVAVGSKETVFQQAAPDAEFVDLHGKTLLPGFIESHAHLTDWAESEFLQFTCYHITNIGELQNIIRTKASAKNPHEWVVGYGYNDSMVEEARHLHFADLDAACADHPVFIIHGSGHLAYVNSAALQLCGITASTPIPEGGCGEIHLDAHGKPSGLLIGQAYNLALSRIPKYSVAEYKSALRKGIAALNAKGVCSIGDGHVRLHGRNQYSSPVYRHCGKRHQPARLPA